MTQQITYKLSKLGHEKILLELEELKSVKRVQAVERLAKARAMGDLSENSEYSAAKEDLSFTEGRIQEIEEILKNVEIVDDTKLTGKVHLGSTIDVEVRGSKDTITIVGELESDIANKKISDSSPIGKALIGSKVGDDVKVKIPAGEVVYKVLKIS